MNACKKITISALLCSTALLLCAESSAVRAETSGAEATSLEEIVVTARRRAESLQNTPVSVTAFTSKEISARHIDNISQIANSTPNLVFNSSAPVSGSNSAASIFIRGIGQTDFTLVTDPGVGLYLDGVYIARSVGGVLDLVDTERVEVLRGPQGTLFGKNTIGGAINIISKKPGDVLGGSVEVKTGTGHRLDVKASLDLPITKTLSVRASFATLNQDGYVKNLGGGPNLNNTDAQIGRFVADLHPNEKFNATFSADITRRREQAQAMKLLNFNPNAGAPTFGPFNGAIAPFLGVPAFDLRFAAGGPFDTNQGPNPNMVSNLDVYGLSLTMSYDFGGVAVKSISAYRKFTSKFGRDSDNSPFVIVESQDDMKQHQVSQELQLSGTSVDNKLNWIVGGYYFKEKGDNLNLVRTTVLDIKSGGAVDNDSWAGFGHASYSLTNELRLNIGARYTRETKRFTPDQQVLYNDFTLPIFGGAGFTDGQRVLPFQEFSDSFHNFSGSAGLDYHITENLMTYVSFSQGFKSGGFNQRVFPPRAVPGSFKPEKANVYETGWKFSNDDHTFRLDGSAFYTDYKDIQVKIIDVVAPGLGNAASGRIYGGELEATALVTPELLLQFGAGYLDTKYSSFDANFDLSQGITTNNRFVNSPKWSLSGSASYTVPVQDYGSLALRVDWSFRSKVYNDAANSEAIAQGPLHLFNAGATFTSKDGNWEVAAQVRNLTNKVYLLTGNDEYNGFGYVEGVYARPREWSLAVKRSF